MIDEKLLDDFMHRFFEYGSWNAKLWFVGMEEGGGESVDEIAKRLRAWDRSDDLADIAQYHAAIGERRWFSNEPKIQSTWGKLMRVALAAQGKPSDTEAVRRYQRDSFGRRGGNEAVIELLPLPSPSTAHWPYQSFGIPAIATRDRYRDSILPARIAQIRQRIEIHQPEAVVFYGIGYQPQWEAVIHDSFMAINGQRFAIAKPDTTLFAVSPHPVATGVTNADFETIGHWIRDSRTP